MSRHSLAGRNISGNRKPFKPYGKQQHEKQSQKETWKGNSGQRNHRNGVVYHSSLFPGRNHSQWNGDDRRNDQRVQRQKHCGLQVA